MSFSIIPFLFLGIGLSAFSQECWQHTAAISTESIETLADDLSKVVYENDELLFGCSWKQQMKYYGQLKSSADRLDVLIEQVSSYDRSKLSRRQRRKVAKVLERMECIKNERLDEMEIHCSPDVGKCDKRTLAHVTWDEVNFLGILISRTSTSNKITICEEKMDVASDFVSAGILFHELSHHCGTDDIEYFALKNRLLGLDMPRVKSWERNADHFEYWYHNGFCVPEVDC